MTSATRLGKVGLRTLAIGLIAMGLALSATMQFNTTKAHASTADPSVWVSERVGAPYGWILNGTSGVGAECSYQFPVGSPAQRRVIVHSPAVQTGGYPATIEWFVQLYRADTNAPVTPWFTDGMRYSVPANFGPAWLASSIAMPWAYSYSYPLKAQIYVRFENATTYAEIGHRWLFVTQYSASGMNSPNC